MASGVRLTIEDFKNRLFNINPSIEVISKKYKNMHTSLTVRCKICHNEWEARKLSYDFYLPKYNLLIEYQGRQHYAPIELFGGEEGLKIRRKYDNKKRAYAKSHSIDLLEISYKDDIEEKLEKYFKTKSRND